MKKSKYAQMDRIENKSRNWPSKKVEHTPLWCAVDLRDGNQALPNPMTPDQKLEYYELLRSIGFKEIEIGFPSASEDDFQFCRKLIEEKRIPDDTMISVLTQARPHLIDRTIEALAGAKQAVVHLYIATSELHMKYVFDMDKDAVIKTAIASTKQIKDLAAKMKNSKIGFEFSPEEFSDTDIDYAVEICEKIIETWNPEKGEKVILNLPMTVERRMPNEYADLIELFIRKFKYNDKAIISVHVHNDMGCAAAASMMSLLAGAERVEGTLLGHGERTGNLDIITLALNLHYLGIDTGLNFENLPQIVDTVERITGIPVNARHPYSGELVFTAFSGSHQDAIHKGLSRKDELVTRFGGWKVPYLHVDPTSLGRSFEKFIRINSQSGKGGIAFIMERDHHIKMPRWLQLDFASRVQIFADKESRELGSSEIFDLFKTSYMNNIKSIQLINYWPRPHENDPSLIEGEVHISINGALRKLKSEGNGPISALVHALREITGIPSFTVEDYVEDSMGTTAEADAICFVKIADEKKKSYPGVGTDPNVTQAAAKAVISGLNLLLEQTKE